MLQHLSAHVGVDHTVHLQSAVNERNAALLNLKITAGVFHPNSDGSVWENSQRTIEIFKMIDICDCFIVTNKSLFQFTRCVVSPGSPNLLASCWIWPDLDPAALVTFDPMKTLLKLITLSQLLVATYFHFVNYLENTQSDANGRHVDHHHRHRLSSVFQVGRFPSIKLLQLVL